MKTKLLIVGLAISMAIMGSAMAEDLTTMGDIPAEAMSQGEMDMVEGKNFISYVNGFSYFINNDFFNTVTEYGKYNLPGKTVTWSTLPANEKIILINSAQISQAEKNNILAKEGLLQVSQNNQGIKQVTNNLSQYQGRAGYFSGYARNTSVGSSTYAQAGISSNFMRRALNPWCGC